MRSTSPPSVLIAFPPHEALPEILAGIRAYLAERGHRWRVQCVGVEAFWKLLDSRSADAAIIAITRHGERLKRFAAYRVPAVNLLHDCHPALPSVLSDERASGRTAAEFFLRRGFQSFGYIGFAAAWSKGRQDGFAEALADAGHHCHAFVSSSHDYLFLEKSGAVRGIQKWIRTLRKPAAVLACADYVASSAVVHWETAGVRVPDEVAIMGVGNLTTTCELAPVPLTSVSVDFHRMSYEAARVLDHLLESGQVPRKPKLLPPVGVVARQSTDRLHFADQHVSTAMRLILDRAADGISIKQLLRHVPVSRKWLDVRFKELIGHTPSQEIRRARMEHARELLLHSDLPIRQIATRCGFARAENFTRFFRDGYGVPPEKYRLMNTSSPRPA